MIPYLHPSSPFPPVTQALRQPNGLLAAGADLSPARLLEAYRHGIFPWYSPGDPILWWSPDPRMVLFPAEMKISKSLRKTMRSGRFEVLTDTAFEAVMHECAAPRDEHGGTWIQPEIVAGYSALHRLGHAHSVETWLDGKLVGGLYGVAIGHMFYGESMFSRVSDASKVALAHLCLQLQRWKFGMIDCQMNTSHLASLGAREIPRTEFLTRLQELIHYPDIAFPWRFDHELVA